MRRAEARGERNTRITVHIGDSRAVSRLGGIRSHDMAVTLLTGNVSAMLKCELNPEYVAMARRKIESDAGLFADVSVDGEARTATTQLDLLEVAG